MSKELWKSESNSFKQSVLSAGCAALGLVLMIGFHNFESISSNAGAGFLLGLLLLLIGVPVLLKGGRQTILIDPEKRRIKIEDKNRFSKKERTIMFVDITKVSIGYFGKRSNYTGWYYLSLKLRSGENYALFSPGRFFEGSSDRAIVTEWKQRLEEYLTP